MLNERPPLRLAYEPDDYLCTWSVPDHAGGWVELPGNLEAKANRPPQGSIYGSVPLRINTGPAGGYSASFPQTVRLPVLRGLLANGGTVFLLDATLRYVSSGEGHLSGSAALAGHGDAFSGFLGRRKTAQPNRENEKAPLISSVRFQIDGLDAVLGASPIKQIKAPFINPDNPRDEWAAYLDPDASGDWNSNSVSLSLRYDARMRAADAYEFRLAFSPVASFIFNESVTLRTAVDDFVEPLRRIISISTGASCDLTYASVELEGRQGQFQVFGSGITQAPFGSSYERLRRQKSAIHAKPDQLSMLDLVLKWRDFAAEHHPLVETYGSMLHARDQHPRSRFLLLIQALEGMYGYETREEYETRRAAHIEERTRILDLVLADDLDSAARKFLKAFLLKNPPSSLEAALTSMVQKLPVNMMDRLAATSLVQQVVAAANPGTTTPNALRIVRNDLAHGKRGYDANALDDTVDVLELIVRGHALRILGCPDAVVERILDTD
ncbi:hypothetical protein [Kribbella speibonae]|uniref:ApeA N-terminal domain-containing protein n=1 Tax=Kribbella speibonae TaxID=1572660 RepID=A0A4R0IPV0_9ACTN|nr:hypothetical protein [Kribbella speibonae]TCC30685.1 hypothetical protein E0H92_36790 [Kribbella speibonae]